jgi:hypothetical protein
MICTVHQIYFSGDKIEKNEMGRACSTFGREKRCIQDFGRETRGKEPIWKTQALFGK